MRFLLVLLLPSVAALVLPPYGIGALFPVRGKTLQSTSELDKASRRETLLDASDFFVDAFWTGKVGGGSKVLTDAQKQALMQQQVAEFNKRYGGGRRESELLVSRNNANEVIACVAVEVDAIREDSMTGPIVDRAPLMSNLAVSRNYRRRGLAEELVQAVEDLVGEWGYEECYLYVEQRNQGAVKLYRKLGYRSVWEDDRAETLLPTDNGRLSSSPTVIVCMRKDLGGSFWSRLFQK